MRSSYFLRGSVFLVSLFFVLHVNSAFVNGQPGDSDWTIASKAAQETDAVSPAFPTLIFQTDVDAGGGIYTVSQEGNYKLAESIVGEIAINSDDVMLDLNGYEIVQNVDAAALFVFNSQNSRICNGTIRYIASSSNPGLSVLGCSFVHFENLIFLNCFDGIFLGGCSDCSVAGCHVESSTNRGIFLNSSRRTLVKNCCVLDSNPVGFFLQESSYNIIQDCVANGISSSVGVVIGFVAQEGTGNLFMRCIGKNIQSSVSISATGFRLDEEVDSKIINCLVNKVWASAANGILLSDSINCLIARNELYNCDIGLRISGGTGNVAMQNRAYNNSTVNYSGVSNTTTYDRTSNSNPTIILHNADIS